MLGSLLASPNTGSPPGVAAAPAALPAGAIVSFTAAADAYVTAAAKTKNFGTATELRIQSSPTTRSYIQFNLNLGTDIVSSAKLQLNAPGGGSSFRVWATSSNWQETRIKFQNAPDPGQELATVEAYSSGRLLEVVDDRLTSYVRQNPNGKLSVVLTTDGGLASFSSRETANPPRLEINAAPATPTLTPTPASTPTPPPTPTVTPTPTATPIVGPGVVVVAAGDISCSHLDPLFNNGLGTYNAPDPEDNDCHQLATSELALGINPQAVLAVGDTQYEDGTPDEYASSYANYWGRLLDRTYPVPGNHEYRTVNESNQAVGYFGYFGARAGQPSQGYYSFDLGSWHFVALNTNRAENVDCFYVACQAGSAQLTWLENDLRSSSASCTLAYFHHARFSTGSHGDDAAYADIWDLLYRYGVDLVVNGHDHAYERFHAQNPRELLDPNFGIVQFIVGTGGKDLTSTRSGGPNNSAVQQATAYGVLKLTLRSGGYDFEFVPEFAGSFSDSGSGSCHGQPTSSAAAAGSTTPEQRRPPAHRPPAEPRAQED